MGRLAYRLYKLSLVSGLVLALPLLLGAGWYAWSAYAGLDRYRRSVEADVPITAELFQIALHDELDRDLRRFALEERRERSRLPTFELSLTRKNHDTLNDAPVQEGAAS